MTPSLVKFNRADNTALVTGAYGDFSGYKHSTDYPAAQYVSAFWADEVDGEAVIEDVDGSVLPGTNPAWVISRALAVNLGLTN